MVDAGREVDEVALLEVEADPLVVVVPDLEVSAARRDQPDLLILVKVLRVELLKLHTEQRCQVSRLGLVVKALGW